MPKKAVKKKPNKKDSEKTAALKKKVREVDPMERLGLYNQKVPEKTIYDYVEFLHKIEELPWEWEIHRKMIKERQKMIALIKHVKDLSAEFQSHNNTKNIPMCDYSALHYTYKLLEGEPENPKGRKKSKKPKKYEWTIDTNQDGVPLRLAEAFKPHRVPSLSQYLDGLAEHLENDVLWLLDEYYKESLLDGYKEKMSHSKKTYCIREVDTLLKQILEQWPHIKRLPHRSGEIRARNLETANIVNELLHLDGDDVVTANNVSQALKDRRRKYNEEPSC